MNPTIMIPPVRMSVVVNASAERAFDVFTNGIDSWWPATHSAGGAPFTRSVIEPFVGGRWYAEVPSGPDVLIGRVLVWEPGRRVAFSWLVSCGGSPNPDVYSEVRFTFVAEGPAKTRVELEHGKFERLGPDVGEAKRQDVGNGWPSALDAFVQRVAQLAA